MNCTSGIIVMACFELRAELSCFSGMFSAVMIRVTFGWRDVHVIMDSGMNLYWHSWRYRWAAISNFASKSGTCKEPSGCRGASWGTSGSKHSLFFLVILAVYTVRFSRKITYRGQVIYFITWNDMTVSVCNWYNWRRMKMQHNTDYQYKHCCHVFCNWFCSPGILPIEGMF